jgi:hypothetical protein
MATGAPTLAQIGATFNDATTQLVGGVWNTVSGGNAAAVTADLQSVQSELRALITVSPAQFRGLTGIHAETIVNQLNLEIQQVQQATAGTNAFAPKEINDIQRDIIDIVQGDANLAAMATQGGANGFAAVPALLNAPTPFQDNAAQTALTSEFVADSNNLGQQAVSLVGSGNAATDANALIQGLKSGNVAESRKCKPPPGHSPPMQQTSRGAMSRPVAAPTTPRRRLRRAKWPRPGAAAPNPSAAGPDAPSHHDAVPLDFGAAHAA